MIEIKGKYNTAKIFTDIVDSESISQITLLLNQEFVKDSKVRLTNTHGLARGVVNNP